MYQDYRHITYNDNLLHIELSLTLILLYILIKTFSFMYIAAHRFTNLKIIDINELKDLDSTVLSNIVLASVPEQIQTSIDTYDLVEAIQNQHQIPLPVHHVSYYGPGYFIHLPTSAATAHLLRHGFVYVHNFIVTFVPWKPDYGSTIVPL